MPTVRHATVPSWRSLMNSGELACRGWPSPSSRSRSPRRESCPVAPGFVDCSHAAPGRVGGSGAFLEHARRAAYIPHAATSRGGRHSSRAGAAGHTRTNSAATSRVSTAGGRRSGTACSSCADGAAAAQTHEASCQARAIPPIGGGENTVLALGERPRTRSFIHRSGTYRAGATTRSTTAPV